MSCRNILPGIRVIAINRLSAETGSSDGQIVVDISGFLLIPLITVEVVK